MSEIVFAIPGDLRSPTGGYAYARRLLRHLPEHGVEVRHLALPGGFPDPSADDLAETARLIDGTGPASVLLIDGLAYGAMPVGLIAGFKRPVVALVHHLFGRTIFQETNPAFGAYLFLSERPIARVYRRGLVIAVSPSTADDLVRRGIDRSRIRVIPNGVSEPLDEDALLAIAKDAAPLFVYLGRIKRYKRIDLLIAAFGRIAPALPDARLVIAGDGDHRAELERATPALAPGARVEFPGWLGDEEKWGLLRRAWAIGYTSPKEGWGFSSIEAQRVGTIAIVSDSPGLKDTVVDGETGRVVPHGDVGALAGAMMAAVSDPVGRARMEERAIERARGYTWDAAATATVDVLVEAARGAGAQ